MRIKYLLSALALGAVCVFSPLSYNTGNSAVYAAEEKNPTGLIIKCSLSCSPTEGGISLTAKTQATGSISKVGILGVEIQRSDDCQNWTTVKNLGDLSAENTTKYIADGLTAEVSGGYYYRVTCTHFATGYVFRSSEEVTQKAVNTSRPVWIEKGAVPPVTTTSEPITHDDNTTASTTKGITADTTTTVSRQQDSSHTSTASGKSTASVQVRTTASDSDKNKGTSTAAVSAASGSDNSPLTGAASPLAASIVTIAAVFTAVKFKKKDR